jgi:hypothetical protein
MKETGTHVLAIIGGAIAAKFVAKALGGKLNDKMLAGAQIIGGVFLPKMIKGPFGEGLGAGMIAVGGTGLVASFGILNGIGMTEDGYQMEFISGPGDDTMQSIAGEDDDMSGVYDTPFAMAGPGELSVLSGVGKDDDDYSEYGQATLQ